MSPELVSYGRAGVNRSNDSRTLTASAHQVRPAVHRLDMSERLVGVRHNRVAIEVASAMEHRMDVVSIDPVVAGTFNVGVCCRVVISAIFTFTLVAESRSRANTIDFSSIQVGHILKLDTAIGRLQESRVLTGGSSEHVLLVTETGHVVRDSELTTGDELSVQRAALEILLPGGRSLELDLEVHGIKRRED